MDNDDKGEPTAAQRATASRVARGRGMLLGSCAWLAAMILLVTRRQGWWDSAAVGVGMSPSGAEALYWGLCALFWTATFAFFWPQLRVWMTAPRARVTDQEIRRFLAHETGDNQ